MYYGPISRVQTSLTDRKFSFSDSWWNDNHISANQPPFPSQSPINILSKPFNSHEWPRHNFSLQYQYDINQISDEYKEK